MNRSAGQDAGAAGGAPEGAATKFDTRIAVVVRDDLPTWQKLNVTAFTVSGVAGTQDVMGLPYEDGCGVRYLPMVKQPILVFAASAEQLRETYQRARVREVVFAIYTEELFSTPNDIENRAAVKAVPSDQLKLVGMALHGRRKPMERVLKGLALHK